MKTNSNNNKTLASNKKNTTIFFHICPIGSASSKIQIQLRN